LDSIPSFSLRAQLLCSKCGLRRISPPVFESVTLEELCNIKISEVN
jgi:hypothetical protein